LTHFDGSSRSTRDYTALDGSSRSTRDYTALDEPLVFGETRPTTPLMAGPPTAPAVTAEGASCAARAVPSDSVSCMLRCWLLGVSRLVASRMVFRAQGESPQRLGHDKREQRRSVSPATRLQRSQEVWATTIRLSSARMGAFLYSRLQRRRPPLAQAAAASARRPPWRPPLRSSGRRLRHVEAVAASATGGGRRRRPPPRGGGRTAAARPPPAVAARRPTLKRDTSTVLDAAHVDGLTSNLACTKVLL
jgi:hypothetical protein